MLPYKTSSPAFLHFHDSQSVLQHLSRVIGNFCEPQLAGIKGSQLLFQDCMTRHTSKIKEPTSCREDEES